MLVEDGGFCKVWRQASRFDASRGNFVAWLVTLTRTRAIDALRRRKARPLLTTDATPPERVDESPGMDVQVMWQGRAQEIRRALDNLPVLQRVAIELAFFDGLTHADICRPDLL